MARLPIPGADDGKWGDVLNEFLKQIHNDNGSLKNNTVTSGALAPDAVDVSALKNGAVVTAAVKDDAITEAKLDAALRTKVNATGGGVHNPTMGGDLSGTASNAQIVAGAVDTSELANSSVTELKLAANAISTPKIVDLNVTTPKLANGAVTSAKLADNAVTTAKVNDEAITEAKLSSALQSKVNGTASITDGSLTPAKLDSDTPAAGEILSYDGSDFEWITAPAASGTGEVNSGSNIGTGGVGVYKQKTGTDLEFKQIRAASNKVTVTNNAAANTVDLDVQTDNLGLTKEDVGLSNVDNTSDTDKPVSTAAQTALNTKVGTGRTVATTGSLSGGGDLSANRTLSLDGDAATPGNSKYYGTNGSGSKGYYDLPSGGSSDPSVGGDLTGTASNAQIASGAVGTTELANNSVTTAKITDGDVTAAKLANNSVTNAKVANGELTPAKLNSDTPASGELLSYNGTNFEWVAAPAGSGSTAVGGDLTGTVSNAQIASGSVGSTELATNAVTTAKITDTNVTTAKLADSAVSTAKLGDNSVTSAKIVDGTIVNTDISTTAAIAQSKIANLSTDLAAKAATATTITGATSLTGGGTLAANRTISLVGDAAAPGNGKYYGTNGSGTKGYYDLPSGGGGGGSAWNIRAQNGGGTVTAANNDWIIANPSTGAVYVNLPAPAANARVRVKRKASSGNSILVQTPNGGSLDGGEPTLATINGGWASADFESDGTDWFNV